MKKKEKDPDWHYLRSSYTICSRWRDLVSAFCTVSSIEADGRSAAEQAV